MNKKIKQKWILALKSGDFKQDSSSLKSSRGYCCLGVLCELFSVENPEFQFEELDPELMEFEFKFIDNSELLPNVVSVWAELSKKQQSYLANLNDTGMPFLKLADMIENIVDISNN